MNEAGEAPAHSVEIYRRKAAQARLAAQEATTPGMKSWLREVAVQYERLAEAAQRTG
jgi:hypothetical protein